MAHFVVEDDRFGGEYPMPASMTFGEGLLFEKVTGLDFEDAGKPGGSVRKTMGLLYIAIRRRHPEFTWSDLEDVDMGGVAPEFDEGDEDPTQLGDDAAEPASPSGD